MRSQPKSSWLFSTRRKGDVTFWVMVPAISRVLKWNAGWAADLTGLFDVICKYIWVITVVPKQRRKKKFLLKI